MGAIAVRLDSPLRSLDGTKLHANASRDATRDYQQIAEEILAEADAVDRAEDERFGDAKGGHFAAWEEPEPFSTEIRAAFRGLR